MAEHKTPAPAEGGKATGRILAGLGPAGDEMQTIEAALALAEALRAEIAGHFVEESNLLDLAALPFAKAFRPTGKGAVPLELAQMQQQIARAGANWRRQLSLRAERSRIACTFSTTRGEYCAEIAKAAASTDIVVVNPANVAGSARNAIAALLDAIRDPAVTVLLPLQRPLTPRGPVVLLAGDGTPGDEAIGLAARIASMTGSELVLLTLAGSDADIEAMRLAAYQSLGRDIRVEPARHGGIAAAAEKVGALEPSFVVWPTDRGSLTGADAEALLRAARAPLLLARRTGPAA